MSKALPEEFRRDVIAVAGEAEALLLQIVKDFGGSEECLHRWLKVVDREDGVARDGGQNPGDESAELRELKMRNQLLQPEIDVLRRAAVGPSESRHTPRMMYPLVLDFGADGIPLAVICRALGFSNQAFYKCEGASYTT